MTEDNWSFRSWTINNFEYEPLEFWIRSIPIILSLLALILIIIF